MITNFKNSVLNQPECVFKIGFQFHTHNAKENILSEKKIFRFVFGEKSIFDQKLQIFGIFKICILSLGYQTFHTKKPFRDKMFLEISVSESV